MRETVVQNKNHEDSLVNTLIFLPQPRHVTKINMIRTKEKHEF